LEVGKGMHLDGDDPRPLARFAAPSLHVEREAAGLEAPRLRFREHREQLADEGEQPGVSRGIRAGRPPDRRLVDLDYLVEVLGALDSAMSPGLVGGAIELSRQ